MSEGITQPPIDDLLDQVDSKYRLVLFAAARARQINNYYARAAGSIMQNVGPLVQCRADEKPLSIALREIQEHQLEYVEIDPAEEARKRAAALDDSDYEYMPDFESTFGPID